MIKTIPLKECSNITCPNKVGEGSFELVKLGVMTFLLCTPCSDRFKLELNDVSDLGKQ